MEKEIAGKMKNSITKTIEEINGQEVVILSNTTKATEEIEKNISSSIQKAVKYVEGHPVVVFSNVNPAIEGLRQVQREMDKIKSKTVTVHVKHTGEGSRTLPLNEKINEIIKHYEQIPSGMDFTANFASMTQGFDEMRRLQEEIDKKQKIQQAVTWVDYGIAPLLPGTPKHGFATPQRESEIESLQKQQELISKMMMASSGGGGLPGAGVSVPVTPERPEVNINVGPISIDVTGTGGDRDLAITLASEMDKEIAGLILHNRSEIVGALGL